MDQIGYDKGLIRYTRPKMNLDGKESKNITPKNRTLRTVYYRSFEWRYLLN